MNASENVVSLVSDEVFATIVGELMWLIAQ